MGEFTSATSDVKSCICKGLFKAYCPGPLLSFFFLIFHLSPPNLTKGPQKKLIQKILLLNPVWHPSLVTRGIQINNPKHQTAAEICTGLILPMDLYLYHNTVGNMRWNSKTSKLQSRQILTPIKHRNAWNHIIDQSNEIIGMKQICLSEGCDGQALCKALLYCNHPLHCEFLQLTSGICPVCWKKKSLQRCYQNT